jgi:hypothetical protein
MTSSFHFRAKGFPEINKWIQFHSKSYLSCGGSIILNSGHALATEQALEFGKEYLIRRGEFVNLSTQLIVL